MIDQTQPAELAAPREPSAMDSRFTDWWETRGQPYEAAVIEAGGAPWPLDPERRSRVAARLSLPEDTDPMELRRALWARGHDRSNAA